MKTRAQLWSCLAQFFLQWQMFRTKAADIKPKRTFIVQQPFPENRAVYVIMWKKYGRAGQATDDNKEPG